MPDKKTVADHLQACGTNADPDRNEYYTPSYVLDYLDSLPETLRVWEPCASAYDVMAKRMRKKWPKWTVHATDISRGEDFFSYQPDFEFDMIITNPPYQKKMQFIERALSFGKPVAFLLPTMTLESSPIRRLSVNERLTVISPFRKVHFIPKRLYVLDPEREKYPLKDTESLLHSSWFLWRTEVPDRPDATVLRST